MWLINEDRPFSDNIINDFEIKPLSNNEYDECAIVRAQKMYPKVKAWYLVCRCKKCRRYTLG